MSQQGVEAEEEASRYLSHYPGDDPRPTSKREIAGWYCYGWAAEVFAVCAMGTSYECCIYTFDYLEFILTKFIGSFLPITLEQLARDQGFLLSDKSTPCSATWNPSRHVDVGLAAQSPDAGQCVVFIFGTEINTASLALYIFALSVLVQAILIISMSGAADHGSYRNPSSDKMNMTMTMSPTR